MRVEIEISPGELLDKLTILQIKLEKITDEDKLKHIQNEWNILHTVFEKLREFLNRNNQQHKIDKLSVLLPQLQKINEEIWDIEDIVRDHERQKNFNDNFIQKARAVYLTNDRRAEIKKEINSLFESDIMEEKSYAKY